MSAKVDKRGKKFRIIEAKTGKLLLNPAGASRRAEGCEILRTLLGLLRGSGGPRARPTRLDPMPRSMRGWRLRDLRGPTRKLPAVPLLLAHGRDAGGRAARPRWRDRGRRSVSDFQADVGRYGAMRPRGLGGRIRICYGIRSDITARARRGRVPQDPGRANRRRDPVSRR